MQLAMPESVGFSSSRLKRIDTAMQRYVDEGKVAGLITTVARRGQTVHFSTCGMSDIEAGKPMAHDAIFRIASMTKPITSVAVMLLYEEGAFDLNTPVYEFIPGFRDVKVLVEMTPEGPRLEDPTVPVTMRHLFTHTSGLSYGWNREDPVDQAYQQIQKRREAAGAKATLAEMVDGLVEAPLAFQPGTHWRYSLAIDVLGRLVEIISGQLLDRFMRERIFEPLGMVDTGFYVPRAKADRITALYGHPDGAQDLVLLEPPAEARCLTEPTFLSGGGGLLSTAPDYARFAQMLANDGELAGERLLSPTTVAMYSANQAPAAALPYGFSEHDSYHAGYGYSLGTRVLMDPAKTGLAGSVGEFGWDGAYNTYFWVDRREQLYGLLMTQHSPNNYYPLANRFKQLTYQAMVA